jgi:hypothetical protein
VYKLEAAERAVYRREIDEEDKKEKERINTEKENVIKTKQYEEELSELEEAMNGMKDELEKEEEDDTINDDIKNDEKDFIKENVKLTNTDKYILIVEEDTIINKLEFENIIPNQLKLKSEEVKDFSVRKQGHTI